MGVAQCDGQPNRAVGSDEYGSASGCAFDGGLPLAEVRRVAQSNFQPPKPLVWRQLRELRRSSRVAFVDGTGCQVMLGKVISYEWEEDAVASDAWRSERSNGH